MVPLVLCGQYVCSPEQPLYSPRKRNLVIEEGSVEALARLQKQDEEFCRRLRAAIETGREGCPTTVFYRAMHEPPCLELYAAGFDPRL
jgi:hypothetical protein